MTRPIQALIDLSALEHNLSMVRRHAPRARVMAVIKADAYGHGLLRAASALKSADGFALLELDAAIRLRDAGYRQPILLVEGFFSVEELALIEEYQLSAVIHHSEQLSMLPALKRRGGLDVFLKLNTGMNRLGFMPEEFSAALELLKGNPAIGQITLMTTLIMLVGFLQLGIINGAYNQFAARDREVNRRIVELMATGIVMLIPVAIFATFVLQRTGILVDLVWPATLAFGVAAGIATLASTWLNNALIAEGNLGHSNLVNIAAVFVYSRKVYI